MGRIFYRNVTRGYDDGRIVAVDDLSLDVEDGQFLVLLGPSGCGKSTTLRMLAGLESVTDGDINIGDERVNDLEPRERDIAMVFQNYALYPHMTVRENIGFSLTLSTEMSEGAIEERVTEIAELMDIGDLLDQKPGELSGGQQQRVALGRAIVREPEVFLFDEPLSNLDAKLRAHMRTELTRLQYDLGVTSIYVTHDQEEAMTMGDRVAILDNGQLQQVGSPNEVYDRPTNRFVAEFIGSPSMNFLDVRLQETSNGYSLVDTENSEVFDFPLTDETARRLGVEDRTRLSVGVRPEGITVRPDTGTSTDTAAGTGTETETEAGAGTGTAQRATIDVVEQMGSDSHVHFDFGAVSWTARTDRIEHEPGTEIVCEFDESALHVFGPDGRTLKSRGTDDEAFHQSVEEPLSP
jgi:multiple sugar transport system ATP-binding protein